VSVTGPLSEIIICSILFVIPPNSLYLHLALELGGGVQTTCMSMSGITVNDAARL
jgi:hypothetical protein